MLSYAWQAAPSNATFNTMVCYAKLCKSRLMQSVLLVSLVTVLRWAMLSYDTLRCAVPCCAMLCFAMLRYALLRYATMFCTKPQYAFVQPTKPCWFLLLAAPLHCHSRSEAMILPRRALDSSSRWSLAVSSPSCLTSRPRGRLPSTALLSLTLWIYCSSVPIFCHPD